MRKSPRTDSESDSGAQKEPQLGTIGLGVLVGDSPGFIECTLLSIPRRSVLVGSNETEAGNEWSDESKP